MAACIVIVLLVASGCSGAGSSTTPGEDAPTTVMASLYPLAWLAEEIGGDDANVRNLTPAGSEPHDLELRPSDIAELRSADVVIYIGRGFQPAIEQALEGSDAQKIDVLDAPGLELLEEPELDPHVWLDPSQLQLVASYVAEELGWDAGSVDEKLSVLDGQLRNGLARCARRQLFTSHAAFGYLAQRYELEQVAITGLSPEAEPRPRDLERVALEARQAGATTIYFETLVSPKLSRQVATEIGAATAVLDPIEGIAQQRLDDGVGYLDVMRENVSALRQGLGCS